MKFELKSIGYWSLIKVTFIVNIVVGFIFGIFYALMLMSAGDMFAQMMGVESVSEIMGFALIILPFVFSFGNAFFGTILIVIIAFVYNTLAKFIGGLELEFNEIKTQPVGYTPPPPSYQSPPPPPPQTPPSPPPPPPPVEPMPPDMTPPSDDDNKEQL